MSETAKECLEAIDRGILFLAERGEDLELYKLISVSNLLDGTGSRSWRLVFKLKKLIPSAGPQEVGKGGELFVDVDLATDASQLRGYGE